MKGAVILSLSLLQFLSVSLLIYTKHYRHTSHATMYSDNMIHKLHDSTKMKVQGRLFSDVVHCTSKEKTKKIWCEKTGNFNVECWFACTFAVLCTFLDLIRKCIHVLIQIRFGISRGRVLSGELYAKILQKLICLHLFTDCFMKMSLQYGI